MKGLLDEAKINTWVSPPTNSLFGTEFQYLELHYLLLRGIWKHPLYLTPAPVVDLGNYFKWHLVTHRLWQRSPGHPGSISGEWTLLRPGCLRCVYFLLRSWAHYWLLTSLWRTPCLTVGDIWVCIYPAGRIHSSYRTFLDGAAISPSSLSGSGQRRANGTDRGLLSRKKQKLFTVPSSEKWHTRGPEDTDRDKEVGDRCSGM